MAECSVSRLAFDITLELFQRRLTSPRIAVASLPDGA
jgi:hypothetical protein